ncbi:MAG: helix-turn-helix domain-containing protein [Candidatus Hermodarchaeota archaeon]
MEVIEKNLKEFEIIDKILDKRAMFSSDPGERLFKCILGLNKTESKVLCYLLKNKDVRTSEIAVELEMDRSSIQKSLQELSMLNLVDRSSMSMKKYIHAKGLKDSKKQGYLYVYNAKNIETIKTNFKELLDKWYTSMLKYVENLDNLCECCGVRFRPC